jgi:preprotein translocase subunit SecA
MREGDRPATLLRGLCMAIVDEADSILIDDARVPLILSERCENDGERVYLARAYALAQRLSVGKDFVLHRKTMSAELTDAGGTLIDTLAEGNEWRNRLHRQEAVSTALAALHLFRRDHHYLVRDGAIAIIDEATGRVAHGRVWSRGLHRLIEMKEGLKPGDDVVTVAQITYQRFFQRYYALCGMSGTIAEARDELLEIYGLGVVKVPLRVPDRRRIEPPRLYPTREAQWRAVVERAIRVSREGRPVLIGTDSVAESEALSALLAQEKAAHAVLNARQDGVEAAVIAEAGEAGRITVATNMAGRGTDIALGEGVAERGGLHVISCQHNASRRIDRQLIGRTARRGDPGSAETLLAVDKPLIAPFVPRGLARRVTRLGIDSPRWLVRLLVRMPQWLEERRSRRARAEMLKRDMHGEGRLAFGRPNE